VKGEIGHSGGFGIFPRIKNIHLLNLYNQKNIIPCSVGRAKIMASQTNSVDLKKCIVITLLNDLIHGLTISQVWAGSNSQNFFPWFTKR